MNLMHRLSGANLSVRPWLKLSKKRHSSHPLEVFATTKESIMSDDNIFIRIYLLSSYMSGSFLRECVVDHCCSLWCINGNIGLITLHLCRSWNVDGNLNMLCNCTASLNHSCHTSLLFTHMLWTSLVTKSMEPYAL